MQIHSSTIPGHPLTIKISFLLPLLLIFLTGCIKNEFTLTFDLPSNVNRTYRMTYYASDPRGGLTIESAVAIAAGKANVKGVTRYPTVGYLNIGTSDIPAVVFYAERGNKISISADTENPLEWRIKGNKVNDALTEWRLANKKYIDAARSRSQREDTSPLKALNEVVAKYVESNPDSPASAIILMTYYDAGLDPARFSKLVEALKVKEGENPELANIMWRQDLLTASAPAVASGRRIDRDIIVQSHERNIDTLRFLKGGRPILLCYWMRDRAAMEGIPDSLRRLARWRSDSASMTIADICLSSDSAQWSTSLWRDSIRHTVRAFSTRGLADPDAMYLGVRDLPWFIIGDGKGKIIYSGSDTKEALQRFRRLKPSGH